VLEIPFPLFSVLLNALGLLLIFIDVKFCPFNVELIAVYYAAITPLKLLNPEIV